MCEKDGFIPRYYVETPADKVDRVLQDLQFYTKSLVMDEMGLGAMIESAVANMTAEKANKIINENREDEEIDEEAMEDEDLFSDIDNADVPIDDDPRHLLSLLEQEDEEAEHDYKIGRDF